MRLRLRCEPRLWLRQAVLGAGTSFFFFATEAEGGKGTCEEKRVHVSEICRVGGAVVFMREKGKVRGPPLICLYRGTEKAGKKI